MTNTNTEFIIPASKIAWRTIWPAHDAGLGLFLGLVDMVTVEVPDPDNEGKRIGLVWRGAYLTDLELAEHIGCSLSKLRYEKRVLFELGLLVERRYSTNYRLAIRSSGKKCQKASLDDHIWLKEALEEIRQRPADPPQIRQKSSQNRVKHDSVNRDKHDSRSVQRDSHSVQRDSLSGLDQQNHDHTSPDQTTDQTVEREGEPNPKSSLSSLDKKPSPNPTSPEIVAKICSDLYAQKSTKSEIQTTFTGKCRDGIAELLKTHSPEHIVAAYQDFIRYADDFEMRQGPKRFTEGGFEAVLPKALKRLTSENKSREVQQKREEEIRRIKDSRASTDIENTLLEEQEYHAWTRYIASPDSIPSEPIALERAKLRREMQSKGMFHCSEADHVRLAELRTQAHTPEFEAELAARLAEPEDVRTERSRQLKLLVDEQDKREKLAKEEATKRRIELSKVRNAAMKKLLQQDPTLSGAELIDQLKQMDEAGTLMEFVDTGATVIRHRRNADRVITYDRKDPCRTRRRLSR